MTDHRDQTINCAVRRISRRSLAAVPLALAVATTGPDVAMAAANRRDAENKLSADDRLALVELISRYAWNYDCGSADGTAATFTEDGIIEVSGVRSAHGRTAIIRLIEQFYETARGNKAWQHITSNHIFDGSLNDCAMHCYWSILETMPITESTAKSSTE